MTTSRLSYASSPESDLEMSTGPSNSLSLGNLPQLVKASSDPSIATNQDNLERDVELNNLGDGLMPPPYTVSGGWFFLNFYLPALAVCGRAVVSLVYVLIFAMY